MIFTKEEFQSFTPINGYVVIEIDHLIAEKIYFKSGVELSVISHSNEASANQSVRFGKVAKIPSSNVTRTQGYHFATPIEIETGDTVYWSRYAIATSMNDQATGGKRDVTIECDGKLYFTILYPELLMAIRNERSFGLNDYIIAEPISDVPKTFLYVPEIAQVKYVKDQFKVVHKPTGYVEYFEDFHTKANLSFIETGDTLLTEKSSDMFMEDEFHQTLPARYVAFQSRKVCGVLEAA